MSLPCTVNGHSSWSVYTQCNCLQWWVRSVNVIVHKSWVPIKDWVSDWPAKQSTEIVVIRFGIERQCLQVAQQGSILNGKPGHTDLQQNTPAFVGLWDWNLPNPPEATPREGTPHEGTPCEGNTGEHRQGLEVVLPSEFTACVTVIWCKQWHSCQPGSPTLMKWNVQMGVWAPEFFWEAEVDDTDHACSASNSHKNIARF